MHAVLVQSPAPLHVIAPVVTVLPISTILYNFGLGDARAKVSANNRSIKYEAIYSKEEIIINCKNMFTPCIIK
jgi:hypothetical protein